MDQKIKDILDEVGKVIRGKDEQIQMVLTAILAKGHILIEDIPGRKNDDGSLLFPCDGIDRAPSSVYTGCSSE